MPLPSKTPNCPAEIWNETALGRRLRQSCSGFKTPAGSPQKTAPVASGLPTRSVWSRVVKLPLEVLQPAEIQSR